MKKYIVCLTWVCLLVFLFLGIRIFAYPPVPTNNQNEDEAEYLIISDEIFIPHLIPLKNFRIQQGITTTIYGTNQIGFGVDDIRNFINNAYYSWAEPPTTVFLVGDVELIPAPVWENYCLSDNIYGDVNNDDLPEIVVTRLPVNTVDELELYIQRIINFELSPISELYYYDHPLSITNYFNLNANSWMVSEIFNGWYENEMNKLPAREYMGDAIPEFWPNEDLFTIFGPSGLNYIPESPSYLYGYNGGNAAGINDALNAGAMSVFSFAQGNVSGWYSPDYFIGDLNALVDAPPGFLISMNSLNGKFDLGSADCFAEAYLKHPFGGVGVIAPSELIYSPGLEWFSVGLIDGLWDDFLPQKHYMSLNEIIYPAEALMSAKYFLEAMAYPINPTTRKSFFHLFHYFGEPFVPLSDQVPMQLIVAHDSIVFPGQTSFEIQADSGTKIALVINSELMSVSVALGFPQPLPLMGIEEGDSLHITVTGKNFQRYHSLILCVSPQILDEFTHQDFMIFPNPVKDRFILQFDQPFALSGRPGITNLMGRETFGWSFTYDKPKGCISFELKEIENGIYLLILPFENKYLIYKFIVVN